MIRSNLVGSAIVLMGINVPVLAASSPDPMGIWMRGDGNAQVRIARCGTKICATNLWIRDPSTGESVGDVLVMSVKPQSDTTLDGSAFDTKRNMTYSMHISIEKSGITTRGCVLAGILCKTMTWSRVR